MTRSAGPRPHTDLPVLVVGAGPVGITAAAELARHAVPVLLVEQTSAPGVDWRASTFHPPTLELLDELGVAPAMMRMGLACPKFQHRDRRRGLVAEFDFGLLADETAFPFRLQLNQQHLVHLLADRLASEGLVTTQFATRLTALRQTEDGTVVATVTSPDGVREIEASHVIGADGADSTVRRLLDLDFDGHTYPERFLIVSTVSDLRELLPDIGDVNYVSDPSEWLFVLRTVESWRVVYPVPVGQSREDACAEESLQAHLQAVAERAEPYEIVDRQIYNVHQRVASRFRVGNVVVVGDAAHINSPVGGVGLNSGIHDAIDVTRRIARIRDGADAEAELEAFAAVRRAVAVEYVQADTHRNTERLKETDEVARRRDQDELRAVADDPARARQWVRRASLLESVRRYGIAEDPTTTRRPQTTAEVSA